jgi:hypothetical protein
MAVHRVIDGFGLLRGDSHKHSFDKSGRVPRRLPVFCPDHNRSQSAQPKPEGIFLLRKNLLSLLASR